MCFPAPRWRGLIRDAELFLSVWGKQAANLGWSTPDLFGAHSKAPAARFSCMGLLLLVNGGRVIAITAETAVIQQQSGARLTYTTATARGRMRRALGSAQRVVSRPPGGTVIVILNGNRSDPWARLARGARASARQMRKWANPRWNVPSG